MTVTKKVAFKDSEKRRIEIRSHETCPELNQGCNLLLLLLLETLCLSTWRFPSCLETLFLRKT
jgi:hypothetical protein